MADGESRRRVFLSYARADDPPDQPFPAEMIQGLILAIALAGRIRQKQLLGMSGFHKLIFDFCEYFLGVRQADKSGYRHGISVFDQLDGIRRCTNLAQYPLPLPVPMVFS